MACVLTVAVLDGDDVVVGHVGDTRLYKLRRGRIEKLTKDHSPVGEREDAGELSEADAMRHPRRNEVYRDVGSEPHQAGRSGIHRRLPRAVRAGRGDSACAATASRTSWTRRRSARLSRNSRAIPTTSSARSIDAANEAGGKDNVTIVYVEGGRFADGADTRDMAARRAARVPATGAAPAAAATARADAPRVWRLSTLLALLTLVIAWALYSQAPFALAPAGSAPAAVAPAVIVVPPGASIASAMARAGAGTEILVEPGEYRERIVLKSGVRLRSRVSRGASIRLPGGASESDAAVVAIDLSDAELAGFRIVGDAATPLGTGVSSANAILTLTDVEISGATTAAVVFDIGAAGGLLASELHDNPGAGVIVRSGASPRVAHNTFTANATSGRAAGPMLIESGGKPGNPR